MSEPTREQHDEWAAQMDRTADLFEVDGNSQGAQKARLMAKHHRAAAKESLSETERTVSQMCGQTAGDYSRARANGSLEGVGVSSLLKR